MFIGLINDHNFGVPMKKIFTCAAILASVSLVGCGGSSSGGSAGPESVSVTVAAPADFLPVRTITTDGGNLQVSTYLEFDPMFTDEDLKAKTFVVDGGTKLTDTVQPGRLMTAAAYNHTMELILSDVLGVMGSDYEKVSDLNALSTAITRGLLEAKELSTSNGIEDDIGDLSIASVLEEAAVLALQLDGYSRTDAENATDSTKDTTLASALASKGASADLKRLFAANLTDTTWKPASASHLKFYGPTVAYTASGVTDLAVYDLSVNNGSYIMTAEFEGFGYQVIDLTAMAHGGNTMTMMGETFTRQ